MRNQTYRRLLSLLLAFCLVLGMVPNVLAEEAVPYAYLGETQEVHDQVGLEAAIAAAPTDGTFMNIAVTDNFDIVSTVEIPAGKRLCIFSKSGRYKISGVVKADNEKSTKSMFYAYDPSALGADHGAGKANTDIRFENINIDGSGRQGDGSFVLTLS